MLPAIAAGLQIGSTILGTASSLSGNSKMRAAARRQARATYATRMEEIRRLEEEFKGTYGYNRAAIGASNIQFSGSAKKHLQDIQSKFARDIYWRQEAARKERRSIRKGAPTNNSTAIVASGIGNIGNALLNYHG